MKQRDRVEHDALLALKMEEEAVNRGMQAASRSSKRHGQGSSLEFPEGHAADTLV